MDWSGSEVDLDLGAINWNLRLYIVLIGAANRTGLFGANWRPANTEN